MFIGLPLASTVKDFPRAIGRSAVDELRTAARTCAQMFKGKLGIVPEIAATTAMVVVGLIVLRGLYDLDAADSVARIPFIGPILVTGPKAAIERAVSG